MLAAIKALWFWFLSLFSAEKPAAPALSDDALNEFPLNGALTDEPDARDQIFGQNVKEEIK